MCAWKRLAAVLGLLLAASAALAQQSHPVYVVLWFDTEDYILPPSDDAAKRLAEFLTAEGVPATFKVVGEKAARWNAAGARMLSPRCAATISVTTPTLTASTRRPRNTNPAWTGMP